MQFKLSYSKELLQIWYLMIKIAQECLEILANFDSYMDLTFYVDLRAPNSVRFKD